MLGQHWPHYRKSTVGYYVVVLPTLVQQYYFNFWNFSVAPMMSQCQHANREVLSTTPFYNTQRWPNICLLSGLLWTVTCLAIWFGQLHLSIDEIEMNKTAYSPLLLFWLFDCFYLHYKVLFGPFTEETFSCHMLCTF